MSERVCGVRGVRGCVGCYSNFLPFALKCLFYGFYGILPLSFTVLYCKLQPTVKNYNKIFYAFTMFTVK